MEITIADVKNFLEENKDLDDVKGFLDTLSKPAEVTPELFKKFLETDDGKILVQPIADERVTKAVQKRDAFWEKERLEQEVKKRLAAEILKLNPQEEPWKAEIRAMEEKLAEKDKESARDNLKRKIVESAAKTGIDPFFVDDYLPDSFEQAELYLKKIAENNKKITEKAVNDLIASKKFVPNGSKTNESKIDLSKLTMDEAIKLEEEGKLDNPS